MRRTYLYAAVLGLTPLLGLSVWRASSSGQVPGQPADKDAPRPLPPLTQVVLFNTGIGYFQREGTVEGDARLEMSFPVADMNDLLKTLSIDDGGKPAGISFDGSEPVEETLANFSVDLAANPSFPQLLNQLRGERVEVTVEGAPGISSTALSGTVVGMEVHSEGDKPETHSLNLRTTDGVRRLPLARVARVRFLDEQLDEDFRRALTALAGGRGNQRRRVTAYLSGPGKRTIKIAHVAEAPVWKATYRLDLDAKANKARLLTNAVVENTTESDWKDVRLVLVSGRPVLFRMDLATSLFVPRPSVEPRAFASLRPPDASGARRDGGGQVGRGAALGGGLQLGTGIQSDEPREKPRPADRVGPPRSVYQLPVHREPSRRRLSYEQLVARRDQLLQDRANDRVGALHHGSLIARQGLHDLAVDADRIGEAFRYLLDRKVTVPRQKSALVPVLDAAVEVTRVSVYNSDVHPYFPMSSLRVKNTTGQNLLQGPMAVREDGLYAGDAKLPDLQPGQEKLVSYAMDLGLEVRPETKEGPAHSEMIAISQGVISLRQRSRQTTTYRLTNRSTVDRLAVVEHPRGHGWVLMPPAKPAVQNAGLYRFEWAVEAGKVVTQELTEEHTATTSLKLDQPDKELKALIDSPATPARFRPAMQKVLDLRAKLAALRKEAHAAEVLVTDLNLEQVRSRANLKELPKDSAAYKRIVAAFDKVEQEYTKAVVTARDKNAALKKTQEELQAHLETAQVK